MSSMIRSFFFGFRIIKIGRKGSAIFLEMSQNHLSSARFSFYEIHRNGSSQNDFKNSKRILGITNFDIAK